MTSMNIIKACTKIIGVGRNYADHAKELGNLIPAEPLLFLKPNSTFLEYPSFIEIPRNCIVHHEIELGIVVGKTGRNISALSAHSYIQGYCLALDMTARNVQDIAKRNGYPWTVAKGYDTFTPIGPFIDKSRIGNDNNLHLKLLVDGNLKQYGSTSDMIYKIPNLIEFISSIMTLNKGDVILSGTPSGVGPVVSGNCLTGFLSDETRVLSKIKFEVRDRVY